MTFAAHRLASSSFLLGCSICTMGRKPSLVTTSFFVASIEGMRNSMRHEIEKKNGEVLTLPIVHKLPNAKTAHLRSLCVELLRQLLMSNWGPPAFVTKSTALPVRGSGVGVKKI